MGKVQMMFSMIENKMCVCTVYKVCSAVGKGVEDYAAEQKYDK